MFLKYLEVMKMVLGPQIPQHWKLQYILHGIYQICMVFYVIFFTVLLSLYGRYTLIEIRQKRKLEYDRIEKVKEKELNFAKLEFFTNISHELRSH